MLEEIEALVEEAEMLEEIEALVEEEEMLEEIEALVEEEAAEETVVQIDWMAVIEEGGGELPRAEPGRRDDLTRVQGIGAKSAARLNDAGIVTFAQLAEMDEESLAALIQAPDWRRPDYAQWISQARAAAAEAPAVPADDLSRLEGIGPTYAQRLRAAGIATFSRLAEADPERLAAIIQAPAWRQPDYASWIAQARLATAGDEAGLAALQATLARRAGDNLTLVQGLGATYAEALEKAGIATFADLAAQTPEQLEAIVSAAGLRHADFQAWIDEAALRAAGRRVKREKGRRPGATRATPCPQDLGRVKGIDVVYEQRLYEAGIGTFWELANTPDQILAEILKVEAFQDVDLADLKRQAAGLAVETGSEGRVWEGPAPDDFERIEGIGDVYERRLYAAGICTYEALAGATVAQLAEICQAPEFAVPDYASWIAQARGLMGMV
jgi:predicted flap endonuclease-1-like 5' DNA nuclease